MREIGYYEAKVVNMREIGYYEAKMTMFSNMRKRKPQFMVYCFKSLYLK